MTKRSMIYGSSLLSKFSFIGKKAGNSFNLEKLYEHVCGDTSSDIYEHLPVLYKYAKKCNHVTEMGARSGNSTIAFLFANPPEFVSYDYQYETPEPHLANDVKNLISIFEKAKKAGVNCSYIGADVLKVEIEQTDMLFIDTWHCYDQLKRELELHGEKVNKYIAFHDTYSYGKRGEGYPDKDLNHPNKDKLDGGGGIRPAIDEFLEENKEWIIDYETQENNGLMVITKGSK